MLNLYVVGCGGTGCELAYHLPKILADLALAVINRAAGSPEDGKRAVGEVLKHACDMPVFNLVKTITFIDADVFEPKNALRQMGIAGPKAVTCANSIKRHILAQSWLQNVEVKAVTSYLKKTNIEDIIPRFPEESLDGLFGPGRNPCFEDVKRTHKHINLEHSLPVIMLAVDKLFVRYIVSKYRCVTFVHNIKNVA